MGSRKLSETDRRRACDLLKDGHTQAKVADFYGVSQSTISSIAKESRYRDEIDSLQGRLDTAAAVGLGVLQGFADNQTRYLEDGEYEVS